jgi:hypothetical protein
MKTIEVKKGKFGMMYRTSFNTSWLNFPDNVTTHEQMRSFFKSGKHYGTSGTYNEVDLVYVNDSDKHSKYYKVIKKDNRTVTLKVDNEKILQLVPEQFLSIIEQIDILKVHSDRLTDQEAQELTDERQILRFYKDRADMTALDSLHMKIESSISEEKIKELCEAHAKKYFNLPAQVEL